MGPSLRRRETGTSSLELCFFTCKKQPFLPGLSQGVNKGTILLPVCLFPGPSSLGVLCSVEVVFLGFSWFTHRMRTRCGGGRVTCGVTVPRLLSSPSFCQCSQQGACGSLGDVTTSSLARRLWWLLFWPPACSVPTHVCLCSCCASFPDGTLHPPPHPPSHSPPPTLGCEDELV